MSIVFPSRRLSCSVCVVFRQRPASFARQVGSTSHGGSQGSPVVISHWTHHGSYRGGSGSAGLEQVMTSQTRWPPALLQLFLVASCFSTFLCLWLLLYEQFPRGLSLGAGNLSPAWSPVRRLRWPWGSWPQKMDLVKSCRCPVMQLYIYTMILFLSGLA